MANKRRDKALAKIGVKEVHKGAFVAQDAYTEPRPYFDRDKQTVDINHCPKCGEYLHDEMGHMCKPA